MLWRWFQEWRIRREALKDIKKRQLDAEWALQLSDINPLELASIAVKVGDLSEATIRWEEARVLMPNVIVKSEKALLVLLGLKRFDEAEALLRLRAKQTQVTRDPDYISSLAHIAERRQEFPNAAAQWKAVRILTPNSPYAYAREAICLRALGKLDEADTLLDQAIQLTPNNRHVWLEAAQLSDQRLDWSKSLIQWKTLADRFGQVQGFIGLARALIGLDRVDEAEACLTRAATMYPSDRVIADALNNLKERRLPLLKTEGP